MTEPTEAECRHWHKVHSEWEWYEIDVPGGRSYYAFGAHRELNDDRIGSPNPDRLTWLLTGSASRSHPRRPHTNPTPTPMAAHLEACKQAAADLETAGHWWR